MSGFEAAIFNFLLLLVSDRTFRGYGTYLFDQLPLDTGDCDLFRC